MTRVTCATCAHEAGHDFFQQVQEERNEKAELRSQLAVADASVRFLQNAHEGNEKRWRKDRETARHWHWSAWLMAWEAIGEYVATYRFGQEQMRGLGRTLQRLADLQAECAAAVEAAKVRDAECAAIRSVLQSGRPHVISRDVMTIEGSAIRRVLDGTAGSALLADLDRLRSENAELKRELDKRLKLDANLMLNLEIDRLRKALTDFAEHGLRHDLNPTVRHGKDPEKLTGFFVAYLNSADELVRSRAREALEGDDEGTAG